MGWKVNPTLGWALGIGFLSALGCLARMTFGPDFGLGETATLGRALDVTHSPLAFIGGGTLALAVVESFFGRTPAGQARPLPAVPERTRFALLVLVVLFLLNCHRIVPAVGRLLS